MPGLRPHNGSELPVWRHVMRSLAESFGWLNP